MPSSSTSWIDSTILSSTIIDNQSAREHIVGPNLTLGNDATSSLVTVAAVSRIDSFVPSAAVIMVAARLEAGLAQQNGEHPLSKEAEELDSHARDLISDLTEFDVRSSGEGRSGNRTTLLWIAAFALIALFILAGGVYLGVFLDSEDDGTKSEAMNTGSADSDLGAAGPIAGTWDMYWTNVEDTEGKGFTVRFSGETKGTLEILENPDVSNATFTVSGDQIAFTFTRVFDLDTGEWPEASKFEGTIVSDDQMLGTWIRQDWSCKPDRNPLCAYESEPAEYAARLARS